MTQSRYSICITELATEMPRCFSISIQSDVAWRALLRAFTVPAIWIAPANSRSFSVSVVLPASGCEMMANVRRRATSCSMLKMNLVWSGSGLHALEQLLAADLDAEMAVVHEDVRGGEGLAGRLGDEGAGADRVHRGARVAEHLALEEVEARARDDL